MVGSFFFYDLETSGLKPRDDRIMQFGGQRTDLNLKPIGKPVNLLIKLTQDTLPSPEAVLITGITPQQTVAEGLSEAQFLKYFYQQIVQPKTIFLGYNNIRFDDEFMRFLHYRNFYDAYEWHWDSNCSRWDLLDVVRMCRALRPNGLKWAFQADGKPTNRLEQLTAVNKLKHNNAHDALHDVKATIELARLIHAKQPDLFDYLLSMRHKKNVQKLVQGGQPFIYTSGHYPSQYLHTSVVALLAEQPEQNSALVYDLRYDPRPFLNMTVDQLIDAWRFTKDQSKLRLPVKTLKYNRSPAVAPLGVLQNETTKEELDLDLATINQHLKILRKESKTFGQKMLLATVQLDERRAISQTDLIDNQLTVDARLYDGFLDQSDRELLRVVRAARPEDLNGLLSDFHDPRLRILLPLYKARNFSDELSAQERTEWIDFIKRKLVGGETSSQLRQYLARVKELNKPDLPDKQRLLLVELKAWANTIKTVTELG
ncbi:MAG TPA: exodeoxyribonuclease I [Candidatus Dormibacteraeota bacterium]|nr:exodeoxyribonuclease I [Candidatus Dormibacteraeota bacterium]